MGARLSTESQPVSLGKDFDESYVFVSEAELLPAAKIDVSRLTQEEVQEIKHILSKQRELERNLR